MYNYKIFTHFSSECEKILKDLETSSTLNFFQNPEYLKQLIKNSTNEIKLVVIFKEKLIVAVLPLEIKKFLIFKVLQWLGTNYADYCNPILSKNFNTFLNKNEFFKLWERILKEIGKFDLIFFNNQLAEIETTFNPFVNYFSKMSPSKVYCIDLPKSFENYLERIKRKDKKHYYELHRTLIKNKKLNEISSVSFTVQDSLKDNMNIKEIIEFKKDHLLKKKIKNNFSRKFINLFETLIEKKTIKFFLMSLKIQEKNISSCFGFIYKDTFYYYIPIIFPSEFDKFKPGKILILEIIKWCIESNIKRFDFGLGNEKYKKHFSNKEINLYKHLSYHTFKGLMIYIGAIIFLKIKRL